MKHSLQIRSKKIEEVESVQTQTMRIARCIAFRKPFYEEIWDHDRVILENESYKSQAYMRKAVKEMYVDTGTILVYK